MNREFILRITAEIHEGISKLRKDRIFFLVTGHPYFNMVAYRALMQDLPGPFLLMVYGENGYEAFGSNFVSDLLARETMC